MNTLISALALGTAALSSAPTLAAPVVAAPAKPVDQLVALLLSEEALVRLGVRAFDVSFEREVSTDPALRATYARHAGLKGHVAGALRPAFVKALKKEIPALRREIRAIASNGLTATEIADSLVFFASPTGQKVRAKVYETMGNDPTKSPEAMRSAAMSAVMANMKPADYPALIAFGASSAASKMNTLNPRIAAASQAWSDRLVAKHGPRMRSLAAAAAKRYLKGKK
ncbi:MAG: hypothetical protein EOP60_03890 [Sphingomonadales bacterium]|nr:MAG: hypothetical protein EOP60_03890 [Sphingomonadales bacterium]